MPAKYEIDRERKLIISSAWGAITDDDVLEHHQRLRTDPQFNPTFRQLVDMSGLTEDLVNVATKELVSRDQIFAPGTPRAWVAPQNYSFAMARMYSVPAQTRGQNVGVFRTKREAEEWLELAPRDPEL